MFSKVFTLRELNFFCNGLDLMCQLIKIESSKLYSTVTSLYVVLIKVEDFVTNFKKWKSAVMKYIFTFYE